MTRSAVPAWLPTAVLGPVVAFLGAWEATDGFSLFGPWERDQLLVALVMAAAVASYRFVPALGLAIVWVLLPMHLLQPVEVLTVELFVAVLAYGLARYGSWPTVIASAVSVPAAALVAWALIIRAPRDLVVADFYIDITGVDYGSDVQRVLGLLAFVVLAIPWLLGMLLRTTRRATQARSEREVAELARVRAEEDRAQAQEIARLREGQTRLARDVHDVVGHSLAVILAQAESAQFLPDDDPRRLKETFATIADSARESLRSVRQVLSSTDRAAPAEDGVPEGGIESLLDGVRTAGHPVHVEVAGTPRPLPPELSVVAFRVLQEMLTNALKHGRRGGPVWVRRAWSDDLTIEVVNEVAGSPTADGAGQGLEGMRRRLETVGGRMQANQEGSRFSVKATMPAGAAEGRA
ncbi:sensor histidine kinase [Nocardioides daejeonensis]|uniref:sensor histidine kinase n=1 Tax=Nocardioides daejeonensis TaxID=1046556 RepID=UPI000D7418B8|nr:histidine kinase [Nocardioides daejeonensis]